MGELDNLSMKVGCSVILNTLLKVNQEETMNNHWNAYFELMGEK